VPVFIVSLPGADMASVFWILSIATGEWSVDASLESNWRAKLSKPCAKVGVILYVLIWAWECV